MDKRGIVTYLAITFAASYAVQGITLLKGASGSLQKVALLAIPAAAALIATWVSPDFPRPKSTIWPIPRAVVVRIALVIPGIIALTFLILPVLGLSRPDWRMGELMAKLPSAADLQIPKNVAPLLPPIFLVSGFALSVVLGPTIYAAALIGLEYGWRGYLLPRLMPLGHWRASVASGLLWALSLVPLLTQFSGAPSWGGRAIQALAMGTVFGALLGEIWQRARCISMTAICCGCFLCQVSTTWLYLFPDRTTHFIWAGPFGIVSMLTWGIIALMPEAVFGPLRSDLAPSVANEGPQQG